MLGIHFLPRRLADYLCPSSVILTRTLRAAHGVGTKYWLEWIGARDLSTARGSLREVAGMHPAMRLAVLDWQRRAYALDVTKLNAHYSESNDMTFYEAAPHIKPHWSFGPSWTCEEACAMFSDVSNLLDKFKPIDPEERRNMWSVVLDTVTIHDVTWTDRAEIRRVTFSKRLRLSRVALPTALDAMPHWSLELDDLHLDNVTFSQRSAFYALNLTRCTVDAIDPFPWTSIWGLDSSFSSILDIAQDRARFSNCTFTNEATRAWAEKFVV